MKQRRPNWSFIVFILPVIISLVIVTTEKIGITALIKNIRQATWADREQ
jgi:hypothetical protein